MDLVTELRLLFVVGVLLLAAAVSGLGALAQWLQERARRRAEAAEAGRAARGTAEAPGRLGRELTVRQARWRALP